MAAIYVSKLMTRRPALTIGPGSRVPSASSSMQTSSSMSFLALAMACFIELQTPLPRER